MINQIFLQQLLATTRQLGAATMVKLNTIFSRTNEHILEKGNVHGLEAADLGLDRVPNYAPATKNQAVTGVNNTTVMTPKRTTDWAEENVYGPIGEAFRDAAARLP
ncbi:hypothetical protein [Pseudomonas phage D6]|nr:hypothetical protein [Pseudomonas phage D6]